MSKHNLTGFTFSTSEFHIVNIHTTQEAHQLAWLLDKLLQTSFWRSDRILEPTPGKPPSEHSAFFYRDESTEDAFWLVANQGSTAALVSSKPKPDYLLIGKGESSTIQLQHWVDNLKSVPEISHAYLPGENVLKKMHWLHWLEMDQPKGTNTSEFE